MKATGKPMEILAKLNAMAGFAPDEEIELFEVAISHFVLEFYFLVDLFGCCLHISS